MTPEAIKLLDELHAKMIAGEFYTAIYNAWPAISAELTRLREFEQTYNRLVDSALFSCQDSDCAAEISYPLDMLREYHGMPLCESCADNMDVAWSDLPKYCDLDRKRGE